MKCKLLTLFAMTSLTGVAQSSGAYAQDITKLAMQHAALGHHAKTAKIVVQSMVTMPNNMGTLTVQSTILAMPTQGKVRVETHAVGSATGAMAAAAASANTTIVDDGTGAIIYMPAMKTYFKTKHMATASGPIGGPMAGGSLPAGFKLEQTGSGVVDGHAVAIAKVSAPSLPKTMVVIAYIDRQTGQMRQMKMTIPMPGAAGPSAQGAMTNVMKFVSEEYNVPIAESMFHFTPPAGSHLGSNRGMGGMRTGPGVGK